MKKKEFYYYFLQLMKDERIQLPLREDENFLNTMTNLFEYYKKEIYTLFNDYKVKEIEKICDALIKILKMDDYKAYKEFEKLMDNHLIKHLHIIRDDLPIDGYGKIYSNLFRLRKINKNKKYKRKDIFHEPKILSMDLERAPYRYNLDSRPSLYLGTTVYGCCSELHCVNDYENVIGALYRLSPSHRDLYIIDLGCRPIDFVKSKKTKNYSFTDYLYIYPLIAVCSVIAADKEKRNIPEYKISRLLYQWVLDNGSDKLCGIRYFSCYDACYKIPDKNNSSIFEGDKQFSFTKYFINYAFPISDTVDTNGYCEKLKKDFLVSIPCFIRDTINIKEFEINLKKKLGIASIDD